MKKNNYFDIFKLKGKFSYGKAYIDHTDEGVLNEAKVVKKLAKKVILEFNAFTINLFALKGSDAVGIFKYLEEKDFTNEDFPITSADIKDAIIFTETITPERAARLSALGVNGIIVNELDFLTYRGIMTLSMPIGIISGYDKDKITMEKDLESYFKTLENSKVVVDSVYNKLHILNNLKPEWLD